MAGPTARALRASVKTAAVARNVANVVQVLATATAPAKLKVGINGFGRIGRLVMRAILARDDIEVCTIPLPPPSPLPHPHIHTQQGLCWSVHGATAPTGLS